jgi:hypothetical protein
MDTIYGHRSGFFKPDLKGRRVKFSIKPGVFSVWRVGISALLRQEHLRIARRFNAGFARE